jgi:diguanylate cyclase (GGDEF)-like protein/PAS domain S-box-containing protein
MQRAEKNKKSMIRTPGNLRLHTWFFILSIAVLLSGILGVLGNIIDSQLPIPRNLITPLDDALALLLAGVLLLGVLSVWQQRRKTGSKADYPAALYGALGVVGTFALLIVAGWGIHQERSRAAHATVHYHATMLEQHLNEAAALLGRLADRWTALDLVIPEALQQSELTRYFNDVSALKSLLVVKEDRQVLLHQSRSEEVQHWLRNQTREQAVLRWINESLEPGRDSSWIIPDSAQPNMAILLTLPQGPEGGMFFSSFDIEEMLKPMFELADSEFEVEVMPVYDEFSLMNVGAHERESEVFKQTKITIPAGPTITVTASAGPVSIFQLPGIISPCILFFGLYVSYLLAMSRNVTTIQRQKSRELNVEEQRFRSLFFQSPDAVFEMTTDGRYLSLNAKAKAFSGISDDALGTLHYRDALSPEVISRQDLETFAAAFQKTIGGEAQTCGMRFLTVDGDWRDYECSLMPLLVDTAVVGVYVVVKDVTERFEAYEHQRLLTKSLESSDSGVLVLDIRNTAMPAVFVNSAFFRLTGYSREQVLSSSLATIMSWVEKSGEAVLIRETIAKGEARSFTVKSYRKDGTPFWNQLSLAPVRDDAEVVTHYTATIKDVSEKRQQEKQLAHQATHDVLTGLANRALLEDRLEHDVALAARSGEQLAVLFIDLDAFKPINDTLGHRIGDEVLISVARRIQSIIRPTDTLARFGGDEFVLLLPNLEDPREAEAVADRILCEIGQPHRIEGHELYVTASVGISFLTEDLDVPAKMLQQADMAMYKAKQQGRDTSVAYSHDLDKKLSKRVTMRNELQEAINTGQLFLQYQPQVDRHGRLYGLEALVRWNHPTRGLISPAEFIPIAEDTAQIIHLGHWVMTQACQDAQQLLQRGMLHGRMAVNLSPLQFHRVGFLKFLDDVLESTGLPPTHLELEVTEGVLMRNSESAIETLRGVKDRGVSTSIDDFGMGYSSFSYLKDLPVERVKIDKSFIDNVLSDNKDAAVCKGIITMAREIGLEVVAEGVETQEQFERLDSYGCETYQGYYFARPMSFEALIPWIQQNLAGPSDQDFKLAAGAPISANTAIHRVASPLKVNTKNTP